jgi:hypothetical protein
MFVIFTSSYCAAITTTVYIIGEVGQHDYGQQRASTHCNNNSSGNVFIIKHAI